MIGTSIGFGPLWGPGSGDRRVRHQRGKTFSKARFWTVMTNTLLKRGATMDLGRLRARLATPLTEVKSTEPGTVDVPNTEVGGKMVKMLGSPYKAPQDPVSSWRRWKQTWFF